MPVTNSAKLASHYQLPSTVMGSMLDLGSLFHRSNKLELQSHYPYLKGAVFERLVAHHAGRLCAAAAVSSLLGEAGTEIRIGRGLAGEPIWPVGIVGSITHTGQFASAVAALASDIFGIGIDSEKCVDDSTCADIAAVCLTPPERARFLRGSSMDCRWNATAIFCIKEAFYKAAYPRVQRFIEFDELEIMHLDLATGSAMARSNGSISFGSPYDEIDATLVLVDHHIHASVILKNNASAI